jgi:hypothetical protein
LASVLAEGFRNPVALWFKCDAIRLTASLRIAIGNIPTSARVIM